MRGALTNPRSIGQRRNCWQISHAVAMLMIVSWNVWPAKKKKGTMEE